MISGNKYGKPINKGRFFFCSECISAYALLIFIPAFIYSCSDSGMDSHGYANHAFTEIRIAGASAYAADSPEGNTVDIFIYDDDKAGRLDTYQRAVLSHDLMVEAASRTGDKVMAVIVNPQNDGYEWDEISSYEALMNIYADLRMEDSGHPTMSGTFRFRANAAGSVLETAVTPLMSEIRLRSLRCDFSATPYSGAVMTDVSVCLSNANSMQLELLQKTVRQKLTFNQVQFGVGHTPLVDVGMAADTMLPQGIDRSGYLLDYARLHEITLQAWSPLQHGFFEGVVVGDLERYPKLNEVLCEVGARHGISAAAAAVAWILRHPAGIQTIVGTTKIARLEEYSAAADVTLSRAEWYEIYKAAGNPIP